MAFLSKNQIISIEASAQDVLLSSFGNIETIELPINISEILRRYNFNLERGRFQEENVVGLYDRNAHMIYINANDPYPRQVFTIAHELGHYFLHNDKTQEVFYRTELTKLDGENPPQESEANWFAASLLMPKKLVLKYWGLSHNIDELSIIFGVSPSAVYFRLKNLQLL